MQQQPNSLSLKWIKHCIFYGAVGILTLGFTLGSVPLLLMPRRWVFLFSRRWTQGILWLGKKLLGISFQVQGQDHLQEGPCIIACKHQSSWETLIFNLLLNDPCFFLKKDLLYVPFLGWCLWKLRMIAVVKKSKRQGKNYFLDRAAHEVFSEGRSIIIFPEGTRVPWGQRHWYYHGVYALYENLKIPVIPVALDSGYFWPRRQFFKRPGCISLVFLPPLPGGLSRQDFMNQLEDVIETTCASLQ